MASSLDNLEVVASALDAIGMRFVFAGAGILPLLVHSTEPLRATKDSDVVIQLLHYGEWISFRDRLLTAGFVERANPDRPDLDRPFLFWLGDLPVDFLAPRIKEFGRGLRWLDLGYELAETQELPSGREIERIPAAAFFAAKLNAYFDRGIQDALMSKDLEDLCALMLGRDSLAFEVEHASAEIREYLARELPRLAIHRDTIDALEGNTRPHSRYLELRKRLDAVLAAVGRAR